ncbi:AprI/Inh family metalloprotease inhibitor [Pseudaestuariivita sp.]|uniref:AprI/Inh family metalloprotease inhibitor n=1 Tax=Pseudaestuariivita sp. TaxID=2211669 RepID=UPI004059DD07
MRQFRAPALFCAASLAFAACQSTETASSSQTPKPASGPAVPVAQPASEPITVSERTKTKRSTERTSGGGVRTTETTTSSSVSVNPAGLVNVLLGGSAAPATVTPAEMAGNWTLVQPDGKSCRVTLRTFGSTAGGQFVKMGCFHEDAFDALRWELRPGQIVLSSASNQPVATLSLAGKNSASGAGMTLFR